MTKRKRNKAYMGKAPHCGGKRTGFIDYITIGGKHCRERVTDSCSIAKSGKRKVFSTLKGAR